MSELIVIGYPGESSAHAVLKQVRPCQSKSLIDLEEFAVVVHRADGRFNVQTRHDPLACGVRWGLLLGFLGRFLSLPVFGIAVCTGLGAMVGALKRSELKSIFQARVRDLPPPHTSALFMVVGQPPQERAMEALSQYGGTILGTSLSRLDEKRLTRGLHRGWAGTRVAAAHPGRLP